MKFRENEEKMLEIPIIEFPTQSPFLWNSKSFHLLCLEIEATQTSRKTARNLKIKKARALKLENQDPRSSKVFSLL